MSLAALVLLAQGASAEQRVALVLGNSAYASPALELVNPKSDAEDVAAALKGLGFEVLLETDAGKSATERALEKFARMAVGADAALFYFAGHAVQHQGQNYLLPVDAEVTDDISLHYQTVQVESVRSVLAASNGVKIIVLDACRNNPVAERLARHAAAPLALPAGERTRGLRRIEEAQGLIVAYATSPGDVALDGQGRNSPFTKAFLRRLNEPGLEIEMMFRRIAADVNVATGGRQRPETYVSLVSEYYLNRSDRLAWEKIKTTEDVATLRDFLEQFPSSFYALEARYRLQALERAREDTCRRDTATLDAVEPRDLKRLRELMQATACAEVKRAAEVRIAAAEAALAREAAACQREGTDLEALVRTGKAADIEAFGRSAKCPATLAAAASALREIAAKTQAACARDQEALDAIGPRDAGALKTLLARTPCDKVKAAAAARLDNLEAALAREAELCRREKAEFDAMAPGVTAPDAEAFRRRAKCPATIAAIDQKLRELAAAANAACARDNQALTRIGPRDLEGLRELAGRTQCAQIRTSALKQIAEIEAQRAEMAKTCARDEAQWKPFAKSGDLAGIEGLRQRIECPSVAAAIDGRLADLKASCRREQATLDAMPGDDPAPLRSFLAGATCQEVRQAAELKLAGLETRLAQKEETCRRESQDLAALRERGAAARDELSAFRSRSACPSLRTEIDTALASLPSPPRLNTPAQVRSTQEELRRLGCFDGRPSGKLDTRTLDGLGRYLKAKGQQDASAEEIKVSDELVSELKDQKAGICPAPVIAKPQPPDREKPARRQKKEDVARLPPPDTPPRERRSEPKPVKEKPTVPARAERVEPRPARQYVRPAPPAAIPQASGRSQIRSGTSSPIGVGF